VWETTVNGKVLHFHLAGINNQNFIMRDEETGSWWQQVTGEAIFGPLKGQRLRPVNHDELTFGLWKQEQSRGRVLKPDPSLAANKYAPANWEERMTKVPVTVSQNLDRSLEPRALVIGLLAGKAAKAYPFGAVVKQSPIIDEVGGVPVVVVLGADGKSVRAYSRVVNGRKLEFFGKKENSQVHLLDPETGSEWDFTGKAISGELKGAQLEKLFILNDYWFDWKIYHPDTTVYDIGNR
jgi:hypothetical protein